MRRLNHPFVFIGIVVLAAYIAAQVAVGILIKPAMERQLRYIFRSPVSIREAGANLFPGSIWMKDVRVRNADGFKNRDFLAVKHVSIRISFLSLLTSEFAADRIRLEEPVFYLEIGKSGQSNADYFRTQMTRWGEKFVRKTRKILRLITSYRIEKFSIRDGRVFMADERGGGRKQTYYIDSFSLARVMYPPDPEEALPAALYLNATVQGVREGKVLVIGRLNPFVPKKSFDLTASLKDFMLSEYELIPNFPLRFSSGLLQLKAKAVCHENQLEMDHQVRVERIKLTAADVSKQAKKTLVFGLQPKTVAQFFNEVKPASEPFEFAFQVAGDIGDPKFDVFGEVRNQIAKEVQNRIGEQIKSLTPKNEKAAANTPVQPAPAPSSAPDRG